MSILINLVDARLDSHIRQIEGKTLSRPTLIVADGDSITYGIDVDIGQKQLQPGTNDTVTALLRNVPIAPGNRDLIYADVGSPVTLSRHRTGRLEIIGFAKTMPGTFTRYPVVLPRPTTVIPAVVVGDPEAIGLNARSLTYAELADLGGGYGPAPYGAYGIFRGSALIELRV